MASYLDITSILLAHNADANLQNHEGITALMMGSYSGHVKIVGVLNIIWS